MDNRYSYVNNLRFMFFFLPADYILFIATSTFVKERHVYTFKMSLPIVGSNNVHNVSPNCIGGSI